MERVCQQTEDFQIHRRHQLKHVRSFFSTQYEKLSIIHILANMLWFTMHHISIIYIYNMLLKLRMQVGLYYLEVIAFCSKPNWKIIGQHPQYSLHTAFSSRTVMSSRTVGMVRKGAWRWWMMAVRLLNFSNGWRMCVQFRKFWIKRS